MDKQTIVSRSLQRGDKRLNPFYLAGLVQSVSFSCRAKMFIHIRNGAYYAYLYEISILTHSTYSYSSQGLPDSIGKAQGTKRTMVTHSIQQSKTTYME